jgi:hypothetical protein
MTTPAEFAEMIKQRSGPLVDKEITSIDFGCKCILRWITVYTDKADKTRICFNVEVKLDG